MNYKLMRNDIMEVPMKDHSKLRSKLLLSLLILLIIISGAGIVYANKETLLNRYYMMTKSPLEYYTYIEEYGLYQLKASLPKKDTLPVEELAYDSTSLITFHKKELNSVLDNALGIKLTDLEALLGIPLNSIVIDTSFASKNHLINDTIRFKLNDTKLLTADLFLNAPDKKLSVKFPELSDAYLTENYGDAASSGTDEGTQQKINSDLLERITKRYLDLFFSHISNVTLTKQVPLSLDTLTADCNQLTVTITREDARILLASLLDSARSDEDILQLLTQLDIPVDQYYKILDEIDRAITAEIQEHRPEDMLQMKLYVDAKGHILGRELISFGSSTAGYTLLTKDNQQEYEFHMMHEATKRSLSITGKNREMDGAKQGKIALLAQDPTRNDRSTLHLELTYDGVQKEYKDGHPYLIGDFTFTSPELMGIQVTSDYSLKGEQQLNTTSIRLGASPLITIDTSITPHPGTEVVLPDPNAVTYDVSQYDSYLASVDMRGFLNSIADSFGIDPERFLSLFSLVN